VHKKNYVVSSVCDKRLVKRWTMEASPAKLSEQLRKNFTGAMIKSVYEAGFAGFVLHRHLISNGIDNIVVNPSSIEVASKDRVKTDKIDATKMAIQHEANRLTSIHIPSEQQELSRLLSRTRGCLVKERTRIGNQIKSKLYQFGLIDRNDDSVMNRKQITFWMKETLPKELTLTINGLGNLWNSINEQVKTFNKYLKDQAKEQPTLEAIYRSAPGIGPVGARELANELGDMSQFRNEKALFSFTGLTPREYSSGETRKLGHISRCGRSRIRGILIEAAWTAIRKDQILSESYNRIAKQAGGKKAIVGIARKLSGRIRSCFQFNVLYELNHQ
jgi:transposase